MVLHRPAKSEVDEKSPRKFDSYMLRLCTINSVGRVPAFQAGCHRFETDMVLED